MGHRRNSNKLYGTCVEPFCRLMTGIKVCGNAVPLSRRKRSHNSHERPRGHRHSAKKTMVGSEKCQRLSSFLIKPLLSSPHITDLSHKHTLSTTHTQDAAGTIRYHFTKVFYCVRRNLDKFSPGSSLHCYFNLRHTEPHVDASWPDPTSIHAR